MDNICWKQNDKRGARVKVLIVEKRCRALVFGVLDEMDLSFDKQDGPVWF